MLRASIALWVLLFGGCAAQTLLSVEEQRFIASSQRGRRYFLRHSMYVGPFFAYDDRYYISERAFDERVLVQSMGGEPILSADPVAIIPVGSPVSILRVEFPSSAALAERKLKSPRHFTWVYLKLVDRAQEKPLVLVLTQTMRRPADFDRALAAYLVSDDPRPSLASLPAEVRRAVDEKYPLAGMPADALLRCRGYPDKVLRRDQQGQRQEVWQYAPGRRVFLTNDVVVGSEGFVRRQLPLWNPVAASSAPAQSSPPTPAR